jgi:hypothetical protein
MNVRANSKTARGQDVRVAIYWIACVMLMLISLATRTAIAAPEDEVRATFERFVAAQNAHDIKAVESLLLNSPDFL